MFRKYFTIRLLTLMVVIGIFTQSSGSVYASGSFVALQKQYQGTLQRLGNIETQRNRLLQKVDRMAKRLSQLKKASQRSGLLGLPARLQLPKVRAKAQKLGQQVERLNKKLRVEHTLAKRQHKKIRKKYRRYIFGLYRKMRASRSSTQKRQLKQSIIEHRRRYRQMKQEPAYKRQKRSHSSSHLRIHPLDGPKEIRQKADVLKDKEERARREMKKLRQQITHLKKSIKRKKKDRNLEKNVGEMNSDSGFFGSGEEQGSGLAGSRSKNNAKKQERVAPGISKTALGMKSAKVKKANGNQRVRRNNVRIKNKAAGPNGKKGGADEQLKRLLQKQNILKAKAKTLHKRYKSYLNIAKKLKQKESKNRNR